MKYTKYLSGMLNAQGVPNMDQKQFAAIMNVVHLESKLSLLNSLRLKAQKCTEPYRYDLEYHSNDGKLSNITKNLDPLEFFECLLQNRPM